MLQSAARRAARAALFVSAILLLAPLAAQAQAPAVNKSQVSFPLVGRSGTTTGILNIPEGPGRKPAIVIGHGSGGIDGRGAFHAGALNAAGFATLEIFMFNRGGRPSRLTDTFPHARGALEFLAAHPDIDPDRIGVMGFSWGGGLTTLLTDTALIGTGRRFNAHVAFYPVCWNWTQHPRNFRPAYQVKKMTGAPLLILAGTDDVYEQADTCPKFKESLAPEDAANVTVHVFQGATHGWDSVRDDSYHDTVADHGRGAHVSVRADPRIAAESSRMTLEFFQRHLGM